MKVSGWNNGRPNNQTGAGYGVRISKDDRDTFFKREWKSVVVKSDGDSIVCNLSNAFWKNCPELRNKKIGKWMLNKKIAPWPESNPPRLELTPTSNQEFRLTLI
ncbi:MAG: hypothetical protein QW835_07050 [Candidatus Hadarchaeum sp.]